MAKKKEVPIRMNSRVRTDQFKFIKDYARMNDMTEGEVYRLALDEFMSKVTTIKPKKPAKVKKEA